jgi:hypothetical protein
MPESKKPNRKKGKQGRVGEQLRGLRQQLAGVQQNLERTHQLLGTMSATYIGNDQKLHQHSNDIEDKLVGMANALCAYTDIIASALEEHHGLEEGFLPRLNEEILVAAANGAQQERIAAIKAQMEAEEAAKKAEEAPEGGILNLDEMSQEQIAKETDKTSEGGAEYPDGAQFFGE